MKFKIQGNEAIIEGEDGFASSLVRGCKGKIKINTPFGRREVKLVREFKSEAKKPEKAS